MKLYKFRSLNNPTFALDILLNNRLYCASYDSLNDPFEGQLFALIPCGGGGFGINIMGGPFIGLGGLGGFGNDGLRPKHQSIKDHPLYSDKVKICSLAKKISDVRMWAHYGGGHEGIAIEIEFDDTNDDLIEVKYNDGLQRIYRSSLEKTPIKELLSFKTSHWLYEEEWRLIQEDNYFDIKGNISAVFLGCRISELNKTLIKKILPAEIPLFETQLNLHTIAIQAGSQIH